MSDLVKAISDFVAAVLGLVGFVGRPRRRAAIHDDLKLLEDLRNSPDFGAASPAHRHLTDHIASDVAKFSGAVRRGRKREWPGIVLSLILGLPAAFLTYIIVRDGFEWYALLPGVFGWVFLMAAVGMLIGESVASDEPEASTAAIAAGEPSSA